MSKEVTRILNGADAGEKGAATELLSLVYEELRRLAAKKMAGEAAGQTLQATALVHEAWLRLTNDDKRKWNYGNQGKSLIAKTAKCAKEARKQV